MTPVNQSKLLQYLLKSWWLWIGLPTFVWSLWRDATADSFWTIKIPRALFNALVLVLSSVIVDFVLLRAVDSSRRRRSKSRSNDGTPPKL